MPVGSHNHLYFADGIEAIQLAEQLHEGSLDLPISRGALAEPPSTNCINFIHEDDARLMLLCFPRELSHHLHAFASTHKHSNSRGPYKFPTNYKHNLGRTSRGCICSVMMIGLAVLLERQEAVEGCTQGVLCSCTDDTSLLQVKTRLPTFAYANISRMRRALSPMYLSTMALDTTCADGRQYCNQHRRSILAP